MSRRRARTLQMIIVYSFLLVVLSVLILPPAWIVSIAFKARDIAFQIPPVLVFRPTLDSFRTVVTRPFFFRFLANSVVLGLATAAIDLLLGASAAYSLSRFRTGGKPMRFFVLAFDTLPASLLAVPFFIMFSRLKMMGSLGSLIIAESAVNLPFVIWLLIPFFNDIPVEIEEAAMIDGCGRYGAMWRIALPLAQPGLVVVGILAFMSAWNSFFFPLILAGERAKTMTLVASEYITQWSVEWSGMAAITTILLIPPILVVLSLQRRLTRGLTLGGLK